MTERCHFWGACPWCGSHEERDPYAVVSANIRLCQRCLYVVVLDDLASTVLRRPSPEEAHALIACPQFWEMFHGAHYARFDSLTWGPH